MEIGSFHPYLHLLKCQCLVYFHYLLIKNQYFHSSFLIIMEIHLISHFCLIFPLDSWISIYDSLSISISYSSFLITIAWHEYLSHQTWFLQCYLLEEILHRYLNIYQYYFLKALIYFLILLCCLNFDLLEILIDIIIHLF